MSHIIFNIKFSLFSSYDRINTEISYENENIYNRQKLHN